MDYYISGSVFSGADSPVKILGNTNSSPITVLSPNGGIYYLDEPLKVSWTAYKGDFDNYYVMLGNKQSGVSVNVTPDKHIPKYATSYTVTNLKDLVNQIFINSRGQTLEDIRESYYIEVTPAKFNSSRDTLESLSYLGAMSKLFTILPSKTSSNITVLSPNGGETWQKGTTQYITWQDNSPMPPTVACEGYLPCYQRTYDITIRGSGLIATGASVPIAKGVNSPSYSWDVGKFLNNTNYLSGDYLSDGAYTIQVCISGTNTCDQSDSYFKITSGTISTNSAPQLDSMSTDSPDGQQVGKNIQFTFRAQDADNDGLAWNIDWGDYVDTASSCESYRGDWTHITSRLWEKAGTYKIKVTVNDCKGGSDSEIYEFEVGAIIINPTLLGDVNGDGKINCLDNEMIMQSVTGTITLTAEQKVRADVNGNGSVTALDSSLLLQNNNLLCFSMAMPGTVQGVEAFNFTQRLALGSTGAEVVELQKYLNSNGYNAGNADGKFGPATQTAVVKFQAANGLKTDGIVGAEVRAILNQ